MRQKFCSYPSCNKYLSIAAQHMLHNRFKVERKEPSIVNCNNATLLQTSVAFAQRNTHTPLWGVLRRVLQRKNKR